MSRPEFPKHLMPYIKLARAEGWLVEQTRGNHIQFRPPAGSPWPIVVFGSSSSDWRADKNSISLLAQCGITVKKGKK